MIPTNAPLPLRIQTTAHGLDIKEKIDYLANCSVTYKVMKQCVRRLLAKQEVAGDPLAIAEDKIAAATFAAEVAAATSTAAVKAMEDTLEAAAASAVVAAAAANALIPAPVMMPKNSTLKKTCDLMHERNPDTGTRLWPLYWQCVLKRRGHPINRTLTTLTIMPSRGTWIINSKCF